VLRAKAKAARRRTSAALVRSSDLVDDVLRLVMTQSWWTRAVSVKRGCEHIG
jgi:hypothetical protein